MRVRAVNPSSRNSSNTSVMLAVELSRAGLLPQPGRSRASRVRTYVLGAVTATTGRASLDVGWKRRTHIRIVSPVPPSLSATAFIAAHSES